ncbi:MAG: 4-alpha-glucanotransferase [Saprospiraceae bacterium]|nr:4-alpha-glucanotransferase [Saprospiraceae bacterium]
MKIHFFLRYTTQFGQSFSLSLSDGQQVALEYLNDEFWHGSAEADPIAHPQLGYFYSLQDRSGHVQLESGPNRLLPLDAGKTGPLAVFDYFNPMGALENTFTTQPFQDIFFRPNTSAARKTPGRYTHILRVKAPLLGADEVPCVLGHGLALRNWDTAAPLLLNAREGWWEIQLNLSEENFPLGYKYGIWNQRSQRFAGFEDGGNRTLYTPPVSLQPGEGLVLHHDNFARLPFQPWRGAGVAIPVFSLRSAQSFGVGEFTDLPALADWAQGIGLKLIQLLPVNDTSATGSWTDSYPYAAISAFALHPLYLNVAEVAGAAQAALLEPYAAVRDSLNGQDAVDYEAVMQHKWAIIRQLYAAQKADFLRNSDFIQYFTHNKHWLVPYAAFCYLRDKNGTSEFHRWPAHALYHEKEIEKLVSPKAAYYDEVAVHYFVQWHLHRQLKAAADYIHDRGLALKGDIPIGIYRHSCDAWTAPELYDMNSQAGAPPDDFAVNGQNWGFPTYNWARMKADGFAWWRQRFQQMSLYFDAFRIDHILGFFRIWSIPLDAVQGILGYFVPALPVREQEFHEAGAGFSYERLCQPFVTETLLLELFSAQAGPVCDLFFEHAPEGSPGQYRFLPAFDSQQKIAAYLAARPAPAAAKGKKKAAAAGSPLEAILAELELETLQNGLFALLANVILLDTTPAGERDKQYAFRFGIEQTSSYQHLPEAVKPKIQALYVDYFYRRQDEFWQQEAFEKLPALKRSTKMLICGEDLGMVPHCVPNVMEELGILSLEIQRMPKKSGAAFFHPKDAPYLSVVTPSTHDMSTLRGWWEEDRHLIQRFFQEVLGYEGSAPYFCEPWVNRLLVEQHLQSPAMWAIFQLQDLLGMDGALRRENPDEERINVPANPKHYWRYRMHLTIEALQQAGRYNAGLRDMVSASGR